MTPRLLNILKALGDYYTLTRAQIQDVCEETNDRVMRKLLLQLCQQGLSCKTRMEVVNPGMGAPAPVYFPSRKGAEFLAAEVDPRYLHCCTQTPNWQHLYHWTQVAQLHIVLDRAVAVAEGVTIDGWLGEWDIANPDEKEPHKRYRLFTLLREKPRLVCNPDAGFLLRFGPFAKVYFLELDRATSGIQQIANSKTPGFAELARVKGHRKHFPTNMDTFSVLSISPTPGRRDLLRAAIKDKDGAGLWKFCAWTDLAKNAITEAIWYPCEGEASPLVRRNVGPSAADGVGSGAGSGTSPARTSVGV